MPVIIAFNTGTANVNTACASIALTSPTYQIVGVIHQSASQDYQTASFGTTNIFTTQGEITAGAASIGGATFYATSVTAATSWKVTRVEVGTPTHRFSTLQVDDVSGYDRFTANYANTGLTANATTANIDLTAGVSKYLVAGHCMRVGLRWATNYAVTSGGSLSWSLIALAPDPFITAIAQSFYGLAIPANTTSSAKIIFSTTDTGNPSWPVIWAFNYVAGAPTANPSVGNLNVKGAAPTTTAFRVASTTPSVGNLSLRGATPVTTNIGTARLAVGTAALRGAAPAVTAFRVASVASAVGNVSIRGQAPTTTAFQVAVNSRAGNVALAGQAPTTTAFRIAPVAPAVGNVALRGTAPTTTALRLASTAPGVGNLALRGYATTVTGVTGKTASPAVGNLGLAGQAPTTTALRVAGIAPVSGHIALAGQAPTATSFPIVSAAPEVGNLALQGLQPAATSSGAGVTATVNLEVGNIELYGDAPSVTIRHIHTHKSLKRRWRGPGRSPKRDWMQEAEMEIINALLVKPRRSAK